MKNILFISPGPNPPPKLPEHSRFFYLTELRGAILSPVPWEGVKDSEKYFGYPSYPTHAVGNFTHYFMPRYVHTSRLRFLRRLVFYIQQGIKLHRKDKFDIIIPYGTNVTGVAALILSIVTGTPMVPEIGGIPRDSFRFDKRRGQIDIVLLIKRTVSDFFLLICGLRATAFRLLFPEQLQSYPIIDKKVAYCFHEFVPVSTISPSDRDDNYILFMGFPWYLKGVDLLISAWRKIEHKYPTIRLRLVGFFPDREQLENLIGDSTTIDICKPVNQNEAFEIIQHSTLLVLPSRTESMGRVILEAMAARKAVVASDAGGIPYFIKNEETGLLFRSQDSDHLAANLELVLNSVELRERLARAGHAACLEKYSEVAYARKFSAMVKEICAKTRSSQM